MTFRRNAPAALIAVAVIVVAGSTFLTDRLFSRLTSSVEESQFQLMQSILDTALRNAAADALARADIIAALPATKQAAAAKDRERLLAEFTEMFAIQKERRGVDQVQFHLPPALSLLRLHAPERFDDDLTRFRPMVVAVNREQGVPYGVLLVPLRDNAGESLGLVEVGP